MTALYLNLCYNEVCYNETALYVLCTLTVKCRGGDSLKCPLSVSYSSVLEKEHSMGYYSYHEICLVYKF